MEHLPGSLCPCRHGSQASEEKFQRDGLDESARGGREHSHFSCPRFFMEEALVVLYGLERVAGIRSTGYWHDMQAAKCSSLCQTHWLLGNIGVVFQFLCAGQYRRRSSLHTRGIPGRSAEIRCAGRPRGSDQSGRGVAAYRCTASLLKSPPERSGGGCSKEAYTGFSLLDILSSATWCSASFSPM